jgi:hypothetical protein
MDLEWIFNGSSMNLEWIFNGTSMDFQWNFNGSSMDLQWIFNGSSARSSMDLQIFKGSRFRRVSNAGNFILLPYRELTASSVHSFNA